MSSDKIYRDNIGLCLDRYSEFLDGDRRDLQEFVVEFRTRLYDYPLLKLSRWLGYIQGVMIESGYTTVEAERDWTRPLFRPLDFEGCSSET